MSCFICEWINLNSLKQKAKFHLQVVVLVKLKSPKTIGLLTHADIFAV